MPDQSIDELFDAYFDDALTPAQLADLAARLRSDEETARAFALRSALHRGLRRVHVRDRSSGVADLAAVGPAFVAEPAKDRWRVFALAAAVLFAAATVAVLVAMLGGGGAVEDPTERVELVGVVMDAREVQFDSDPLGPGDELYARPIRTRGGDLAFRLHSGAQVKLAGDVDLSVTNPMAVALTRGWAEFRCPPAAAGFTVDAPHGLRIVDLGTAFEVHVDANGNTEFWVTEGRIELRTRTGERVITDAGEGWRHDAATARMHRLDVAGPDGVEARPSALFAHLIDGESPVKTIMGGADAWALTDGGLRLKPAIAGAGGMSVIGLAQAQAPAAGQGWTLETRVRVIEPSGADSSAVVGVVVRHSDGTTYAAHLRADGLVPHARFDGEPLYRGDLTDRLHTFRFMHPAGSDHVVVYVDGIRVSGVIPAVRSAGEPGFFVGDTSRVLIESGEAEFAYLRIHPDVAYTPPYATPLDDTGEALRTPNP